MQIDIRSIDDINAIEINDHTLAFYAGRDWTRIRDEPNWLDDGAMKLGIATYAIYKNNKAVIYDTFADIRQAMWVRNHLENVGIKQFTVVLSHWHLDHIAGNEVYKDCNIISNALTRELLFRNKNDKILLAGDTLEDSITYIDEPENLVEHVKNLRQLKQLSLAAILPNHGDPDVIEDGGYDKTLIDATINYIIHMVGQAHDRDFLMSPMKSYLREEIEQGWVHYYEPYEEVHNENLIKVYDYYKNKQLPSFSEI